MSLIDRYLIRQIGATSLWALLALSGVIWISQALHDIDLMTTQGQSVLKFFTMTLLTLPAMAAIIAPVALLIGFILTLNRLNAESELAVLASAGISPFRLLKPLLIAAFIGSLFTGFLTLKLMPESINLWRVMVTQIRSDFLTKIIKAGRFNELEANVIFHYRERAGDTLLGLFIQDKRDPELVLVYVAERGRIVNGSSGNYLVLENGSVQRETPRNRDASIVAFQRYALDLTQLAPGNGEITYSPHERLTLDLLQTYQSGRETSADLIRIETELADRFATPLYVFPFTCLALAFIGRPRSARAHRLSAILYTILLAALIRVVGFVLIVNGKDLPFYLEIAIAFPIFCATLIFLMEALFGHQLSRREGFSDLLRNLFSKPAGQTS